MMLTLLVACLLIYKLDLPEWLYLLDPPWDPIGSPGAGARRRKGYAFLARSLLTSISSSDVLCTGRACARESSTRTDIFVLVESLSSVATYYPNSGQSHPCS
jgi:hypothetical protein